MDNAKKDDLTGYLRLIERSVDEGGFRSMLASDPDAALREVGLLVNDPDQRALVAKRLEEQVAVSADVGGEAAHVAVLVVIGVAIGTNLVTEELEDPVAFRSALKERVNKAIAEQEG